MSQDYKDSFANCKCRLCGQNIINRRSLGNHLARSHKDWNLQRYVLELCLQGEAPQCKCGCGKAVEWHKTNCRYNDYVSGHNNTFSTTNQPEITKEQIQKRNDSIRRTYASRKQEIASKISSSLVTTFEDIEHRNRMSDHANRLWSDDNFRSKVSEGQKRAWKENYNERYANVFTPEMRRKLSESNRANDSKRTSEQEKSFYKALRSSLPVEINDSFWLMSSEGSKCYDACIKDWNLLIELDGTFWHGLDRKHNFALCQVFNMANDRCKERIAANQNWALARIAMDEFNLQRIRSATDLQSIIDVSYHYQERDGSIIKDGRFEFSHDDQALIQRDVILTWSLDSDSDQKTLVDATKTVTRFFKEYFDTKPWFYPRSEETLEEAMDAIRSKKKPFSGIFNTNSKAGNAYLKSRFKSYWHASNGPAISCKDENTLGKVVSYRMGLNNSKLYEYELPNGTTVRSRETFDISPRNVRNGFVVQRRAVSWFSPVAAAEIWDWALAEYEGESPKVWDPSGGFGARLLSFASVFPKGSYVATEPANMTFEDLSGLAQDISKSKFFEGEIDIVKKGSEEVEFEPNSLDAIFTSPPYFDREKYFDEPNQCWLRYPNLNSWIENYLKQTFETAFLALKPKCRMVINVSEDLKEIVTIAAKSVGFVEDQHGTIRNGRDAFARKRKNVERLHEPVLCFVKHSSLN
jgi:hypothetical protein